MQCFRETLLYFPVEGYQSFVYGLYGVWVALGHLWGAGFGGLGDIGGGEGAETVAAEVLQLLLHDG